MSLNTSTSTSQHSPPTSKPRPFRTRTSKGKSRTGCITCKKRKVRCDEVHPSCTNCARREQECVYKKIPLPKWREGAGTFVLPTTIMKARKRCVDEVTTIDTDESHSIHEAVISDEVGDVSRQREVMALPRSLSCISSDFSQSFSIEDLYLLTKFDSLSSMEMLEYYELDVHSVIQLGFHNDFLLHSMLTLVARNLNRTQHSLFSNTTPLPTYDFKTLEQRHLHHTLSKFHPALTPPHSQYSNHALLATSFLLSFYSCSVPDFCPFDESSILADTSFTYLLGTRSLIVHNLKRSRQGLFRSVLNPPSWVYAFSSKIHPTLESGPGAVFINLLETLTEVSPYQYRKDLYNERMSSLAVYLSCCTSHITSHLSHTNTSPKISSTSSTTTPPQPSQEILQILGLCFIAWQACCPTEFVDLVREYDPIALVILAHFYAAAGYMHGLLKEKWWWWMDKPKVMVERIVEFLGEEWEDWVEWPRRVVALF